MSGSTGAVPAPELPGLRHGQQELGCLETQALSVASECLAWGDRNTSWYFTVARICTKRASQHLL